MRAADGEGEAVKGDVGLDGGWLLPDPTGCSGV